ncbi:AHH domain-containing protein [Myxococcaceae bacterium JPH2]|nr:AHH domain-containing protein [Myxococcaceae bacterium JPH2]
MSGANAHILNQHKIQAVLDRANDYRKNGIDIIGANDGKTNPVYNNDSKIKKYLNQKMAEARSEGKRNLPKTTIAGAQYGDDTHAAGYHFNHFAADNGGTPYPNEGHHMLPCELFLQREESGDPEKGGLFGEIERQILLRVKYDVNNGNNVIFLPAALNLCGVHQLPYHAGSHPGYSSKVRADLKRIDAMLKDQAKKLCETWNPPDSIPDQLMKLENKYWNWIVLFGESHLDSINNFVKLLAEKVPTPDQLTKSH